LSRTPGSILDTRVTIQRMQRGDRWVLREWMRSSDKRFYFAFFFIRRYVQVGRFCWHGIRSIWCGRFGARLNVARNLKRKFRVKKRVMYMKEALKITNSQMCVLAFPQHWNEFLKCRMSSILFIFANEFHNMNEVFVLKMVSVGCWIAQRSPRSSYTERLKNKNEQEDTFHVWLVVTIGSSETISMLTLSKKNMYWGWTFVWEIFDRRGFESRLGREIFSSYFYVLTSFKFYWRPTLWKRQFQNFSSDKRGLTANSAKRTCWKHERLLWVFGIV
jgi:hypothetical protein